MAESSPTNPPAADEVELRLQRHETLTLRSWFVPFALMLGAAAAVYFLSGKGTTAAHAAFLFGYLGCACTFLPLPTAWIVMWMGAPLDGGGCGIHPLLVATIGSLGTAVGNMNDYYLLTYLYRYKPIQKIRTKGWYKKVAAWYNRAPFGTLAAASFLPIPIDFVRLLAISEGYSRAKFVLGTLVGRWPRYFLFAFLADQFKLGWQWILGIAGATIVLGLWRGLPPLVKKIAEWLRGRAGEKEA